MSERFEVSDNSVITIPLRNLIGLIMLVGVAVTTYFSITERISIVERNIDLLDMSVEQNSEFRIKWPRGELGSLPDDAEQNMRLDYLEKQVEKHKDEHDTGD
tara:strand:- start:604 stop:909 length:306 start_codon:yes stop_codon:yes gene_type:complete